MIAISEMERDLGMADNQATEAAERLARNRETMNRVESSVIQAEPNQKQVQAETESMSRRVFRDKCCMLLTSLVVIMIIAVIIVEFAVKDDGDHNGNAPTAASPGNATNETLVNVTNSVGVAQSQP
jgi:hypothetical protein